MNIAVAFVIAWWRELIIIFLATACLAINDKLQDSKGELVEVKLIHENLVKEAELKSANAIATYNRQRQLDAEKYASEINSLNDKYAIALSNSGRLYEKITTYNDRLHTTTRETLEAYAKTGSILYGECRKEYLDLGYYTAKLDAELDKVTDSNNKPP